MRSRHYLTLAPWVRLWPRGHSLASLWIGLAACRATGYRAGPGVRALLPGSGPFFPSPRRRARGGVSVADARPLPLILAKNEASNLPECLQTVNWANEVIVVVDRASRDDAQAIAQDAEAHLVARPHFRRLLLSQAATPRRWPSANGSSPSTPTNGPLPSLPPRSAGSPPTRTKRTGAIASRSARSSSAGRFATPERSTTGRCGSSDEAPAGGWGRPVHEIWVEVEGTVGQLRHHLNHRTIPDMTTFLRKINEYTTLEAIKFERSGPPRFPAGHATSTCTAAVDVFAKLYVAKQGFRDGVEGFAFCALSGMSVAVRHWKHRELIRIRRAAS